MKRFQWLEEYAGCGCVSAPVPKKRELLGYCAKHGSARRNCYKMSNTTIAITSRTVRETPASEVSP